MLHRSQGTDSICLRTLADSVDREGARIRDFQEHFAEKTLKEHGFNPGSCLPETVLPLEDIRPSVQDIPEEKVAEAIERCNTARTGQERVDAARLPGRLEDPAETVYISIDDIGVTRQKESRKPGSGRDTKYVKNTVSFGALFDTVSVELNERDFCLLSRVCHPCLEVKASRKAAKGLDFQAGMTWIAIKRQMK